MFTKYFQILVLLFSVNAFGFSIDKNFKGFIDIGAKELYVDYLAPQKSAPTVVLLNGLTYSTVQWDKMVAELKKTGVGILRYDMDGMGKTLLKYGVKAEPYAYMDQVIDLNNLLETMKISKPYNIVGLSYGGGIAAAYSFVYPENINKLVLMAPYTEALEQQDSWIKLQVALTRLQYPFNPYSDDQLYDYFLKQICYTTYPSAEPIVLENPIKLEGVFRLTQGIRKFRVLDEVQKFPAHSVYLVIAKNDQYIPRQVLEDFWTAIPEQAKVEKIYVENSEHKIPEAQPRVASDLIYKILTSPKN